MSKTDRQYVMAAFMPRGGRRKLKLASKNYNKSGHAHYFLLDFIDIKQLKDATVYNTSAYSETAAPGEGTSGCLKMSPT